MRQCPTCETNATPYCTHFDFDAFEHLWNVGAVQTIPAGANGTSIHWYRHTPRLALTSVELGRRVERALMIENVRRFDVS